MIAYQEIPAEWVTRYQRGIAARTLSLAETALNLPSLAIRWFQAASDASDVPPGYPTFSEVPRLLGRAYFSSTEIWVRADGFATVRRLAETVAHEAKHIAQREPGRLSEDFAMELLEIEASLFARQLSDLLYPLEK